MRGPINIRDMRPGDMDSFDSAGIGFFRDYETAIIANGAGWAIESEASEVVAIGGVIPSSEGCGEAWFIIAPKLQSFLSGFRALQFIRLCRQSIVSAFESLGLHRIQAHIILGSSRNAQFVRCMGFQSEGVRRAWGPMGEDMEEFALIKEGF